MGDGNGSRPKARKQWDARAAGRRLCVRVAKSAHKQQKQAYKNVKLGEMLEVLAHAKLTGFTVGLPQPTCELSPAESVGGAAWEKVADLEFAQRLQVANSLVLYRKVGRIAICS